jgi:uncharacterized protein YecE (DUF72 family)
MNTLYAGTSGWAYASWKPGFYPAKLASAKFLSHYASRLNSVEVNYTFRAFPTEKLLTGWIAQAPPNFRFAMKAHQSITHIKRLRNVSESVTNFLAALRPLGDAAKLGPVLFQLPPNLKYDLPLLEDFLAGLPRQIRSTMEFRHESWFRDDVFASLQKANVALCEAESDELLTPQEITADFCCWRLRKSEYPAKALKALARRARELLAKGDLFAYFKHEDTPDGALSAEELLEKVSEKNNGG